MDRRLLVDTGVLVDIERALVDPATVDFDDDVRMSIVSLSEYMVGIALAQPVYRPRMQQLLDRVLRAVPVVPYDEEIQPTHVELLAWTRRHGCPRAQHDLIIAATAVATGRILVTTDHKARFDGLPGLEVTYVR
ncbi:MAG: PIN domain-containing protein [Propionibacteriaceae bacterium]|jgi:predicted nucleic acid-binding protein|nr:PIN domain-containing protein [Propionibacteriaceae bacterium]